VTWLLSDSTDSRGSWDNRSHLIHKVRAYWKEAKEFKRREWEWRRRIGVGGPRWRDEHGTPQRLQPVRRVSNDLCSGPCAWSLQLSLGVLAAQGSFGGCDDLKAAKDMVHPQCSIEIRAGRAKTCRSRWMTIVDRVIGKIMTGRSRVGEISAAPSADPRPKMRCCRAESLTLLYCCPRSALSLRLSIIYLVQ